MSLEKRLKMMVVEDSEPFQEVAKRMLHEHECIAAYDGKDALQKYREYHPDIVFLDIALPDMDGFEVLRNIRNLNQSAHVVMLTQSNLSEDVRASIQQGAQGYILKPFSRKQIKQCIDSYHARKNKQ